MAEYMGISHRQYQTWETDDGNVPTVAAILATRIAAEIAPDLVDEWPEGHHHLAAKEEQSQ
jgi:transcriptional regulator with XRE-family HTH domain